MAKKEKQPKVKKEKKPRPPEYTQSGGLDYSVYYMKKTEYLLYLIMAAAGFFALGYVFYKHPIWAGVIALCGFFYPPIRTKAIIRTRRQKLTLQFKDMLYSMSSALGAGSSVEMAMSQVLEDMERQYGVGEEVHIVRELELIVSKLDLGENIEDLFMDLADRSGIEDIRTFAHIFEISKRTGGNLIQIMRQSSDIISEKIETKQEMETKLAEKKMEQKVLTVAPIALMYMLTVTTGGFMDVLFEGIGRVICTVALGIVVVGYLWGKKLTDIEI